MGIVNDGLPEGAISAPRHHPNRAARFALGYGRHLNVTKELLDRHLAAGFANRPAIRFDSRVLTYGVLSERVNRLANLLAHMGVNSGCRVLIHLPNRPEFVESWLAVLRIGAVVVATVPLLRHHELSQIASETTPTCLITTPDLFPFFDERSHSPELRILIGKDVQEHLSYEKMLAQGSPFREPASTAEDDVAIIAYTSGTTGDQKGTIHTHSDILAIADTYAADILAPTREDCFACHAPMGFTYGLGALLVFPLRFGASVVLAPGPFDPERWLSIVEREKVTRLFTTPTAARLYLEEKGCGHRPAWESVRTVVSAGEPLSKETFAEWRDITGTEILDGCGSTEMLHIWISQRHGRALGGCTGWPVARYQVQLLDDTGQVLRGNEAEGVAALRGPTGCRYWCQPGLQTQVVRDGWTLSGDRFRRDSTGRYWFVSRTDDMIVSGGYKISPFEVRNALLMHPAVRDAAVVGVSDAVRGQTVRAYLILHPEFDPSEMLANQIRDHTAREIALFKSPQEVVFLERFPETPTGKIDRKALKALTNES